MSPSPAIRIARNRPDSRAFLHGSYASTPTPMAIPRAREAVPPPLPPPPHIPEIYAGQDPGFQWGNRDSDFGRPAAVKAGSSLLMGSWPREAEDAREEHDHLLHRRYLHSRTNSSVSTINLGLDMPDDTALRRDSESRVSKAEFTGERDLRRRTIEQSSQSYDKQLVNRIGGPNNAPKRPSLSYASAGIQENGNALPSSHPDGSNDSAWSISIPERRHVSVDATSAPRRLLPAGGSPGSSSSHTSPDGHRIVSVRHIGRPSDPAVTHRGSYEYAMFVGDSSFPDDGPLSGLDRHSTSPDSPKAGSKRRASSPAREKDDRYNNNSCLSSLQEHPPRSNPFQTNANWNSPSSRVHHNIYSLSPTSSSGPRHGSLGSSLGMASVPSSATSYASERVSPLSPDIDPMPGLMGNTSTNVGQNAAELHRQRTCSESALRPTRKPSSESMNHSRASSLSQLQGVYICDCCPKKPRKFETEEDLRLHESEKQYTCAYCMNRFKNKNEAERHQNSLHLRRQSWSCAALNTLEAAFHESSSLDDTDVCGFCGQEFPNPPCWATRTEHLNIAHKFGECNQSKKFFRADHFRQHLKHSHHGTGGKWTNILENACVKDEPVPEPRVGAVGGGATSCSATKTTPALMLKTSGLAGPGPPGTIEETPDDS